MKKLLYNTLGLRDGEIFISFLMQLYVFTIITVLLIVKPIVNALFVSQLGASNLPYGYLLVAFVAVSTSYFYSKAIRKFSLVKITVLSLVIFSLVFFLLAILLNFKFLNDFVLYFYYVFVSLFAVIATSQFWIFANMVFNAREAKRIFGFIGAGAIAGGIFGGYLTSIIAANFGKEYAIFIASILLLFCIPILRKVYTLRIRYLNTFKRKQVIANQDQLEKSSLKLILKSPHLSYLAFITGIGVIVAKLVDFQFSDFANKAFTDSDELAAFFGFWFSTFNVVAFIIQLFLTNRVLSRLGVTSTLLVLPLTIGLGSLLFLTFPELWVLVLIKGIDGSFKQSLNKAAVELSIMPIPLDVKNQAKSYIDVAVDSIATGLAGFMLLFFIKKLNLDTSYITIIILFFVFTWIVLIYKLREAYFESFKINIQKNLTYSIPEITKKQREENNLSNIKNIFKNGDEAAILNMFDRLKDYKFKFLQKSIIELLNHPSSKVKVAAIDYLDVFEDNNILEKVKLLVYEKDDILVYVALDYLLSHSYKSEEAFFNTYLNHKDEYIANGALLSLAKQSENNYSLGVTYQLKERLESKIKRYTVATTETRKEIIAGLLLSIAYSKMTNHYPFIIENLSNEKPYIVKFATISAGISSDEIFIEPLLNLLESKKHRKRAIIALKSYGPKIIDLLLILEAKDELKPTIKKNIPKIVGAFENKNALKILYKILTSKNTTSRLEASKSLRKIKRKNADFTLAKRLIRNRIFKESDYYKSVFQIIASIQNTMQVNLKDDTISANKNKLDALKKLSDALELELDKSLLILFNLLSLLYDEAVIQMTFQAIKSDVKEAKINSLELLENLTESSVRTSILPILEHVVVDENHFNSSVIKVTLMTEIKYLNKIMTISGSNIRFLAVSYINVCHNKAFIPALLPLKKYRNKAVKQLAYDTFMQLKKS